MIVAMSTPYKQRKLEILFTILSHCSIQYLSHTMNYLSKFLSHDSRQNSKFLSEIQKGDHIRLVIP